mgnify:CR=1 FL=1
MSKLVTVSGIAIPVFNVIRQPSVPALEVMILESQISEINLLDIFKSEEQLETLTLRSDQDVFENQYIKYSKLDTYGIQYKYIVREATEGSGEVLDEDGNIIRAEILPEPAVVDNLITVRLLKKSDLESKVDSNTQLVDAMSVAIAEMIGG